MPENIKTLFASELATEFFTAWPYDDALQWMREKHSLLSLFPQRAYCAVGTHKEKVISIGRDVSRGRFQGRGSDSTSEYIVRFNDRGGGITAHEPGQLVLYPILHLKYWDLSVRELIKLVERSALQLAASLGIAAHCQDDSPGVFVGEEKVGFIGMRIKDGCSSHGLAMNVLNDAHIYKIIDPCGIKGLKVSSLCHFASMEKSIDYYAKQLGQFFVANLLNAKMSKTSIRPGREICAESDEQEGRE